MSSFTQQVMYGFSGGGFAVGDVNPYQLASSPTTYTESTTAHLVPSSVTQPQAAVQTGAVLGREPSLAQPTGDDPTGAVDTRMTDAEMDAYRAALLAQSQAQQATAAFTAPSPGAETVPSEDAPNPNPPPAGEDADVRVGQDGGYDPDVPGSNVTLAGTTDTPIDVPAAPQAQGIVAQIVAALQRIIAALTGGMETYDG